ncbi:MAG: hypothetical protein JW915_17155 [Chitinispirillaceae bacterium]|nr:hypothetical protein [Chitinispirillaceae bacterium]
MNEKNNFFLIFYIILCTYQICLCQDSIKNRTEAKYKISAFCNVPFGNEENCLPIPVLSKFHQMYPRIFHLNIADSTLYFGAEGLNENFIYKLDIKMNRLVEKKMFHNLYDFTIFNDTVVVLGLDRLTYFTMQLDSIGVEMFPHIYKLQGIVNNNYFLMDYLFTRRFEPGKPLSYEYVYSLRKKKFTNIINEENDFFPVTNCSLCNNEILKNIFLNKYSTIHGQSNRYIIYKIRNNFIRHGKNKINRYGLYDKSNNVETILNDLENQNVFSLAIRPFVAINDSQFICVSIDQSVFNGVTFKLMTIQNSTK